ncbi:MAG: hypothetical protein JSR17_04480 [Proteobacteria bacterium]|nr:hypothetical protein [Pseudomonadota bacterium]
MSQLLRFWIWHQLARIKSWFFPTFFRHYFQQVKIKHLLAFIHKQVPFYQKQGVRQFHQLPIIDKVIMQENFEKMNSANITYQEATHLQLSTNKSANYSLGTSGPNGIYLFSEAERQQELASILSKLHPVTGLCPVKVAVFYLSKTPYLHTVNSACFKWQFYDLQANTQIWLDQLNQNSPDIIVAPVQTLCLLAHYQNNNSIMLKPKKIVATQEVLTPVEENLISTAFKQNVFQLYQCAEGFLGSTCEMGTLHLNEDQYYIEKEWIDEKKDKFIPVITSLHRRLQPLVRYRMNDILKISPTPCSCGSAHLAIEKIIGRCEDMLYFQKYGNSTTLKTIYSDEFLLAINRARGGVEKFQLIQHSPMHIEIKLKAKNMKIAKQGVFEQLEKLFHQYNVKSPQLNFSSLDTLSLSHLFRQTQRLAKMPM